MNNNFNNNQGVWGTTPHLKYIESKFLYLNTKNRQSGSVNQCLITFPNNLFYSTTQKKQILKINLQDISILKEWTDIIQGINNEILLNGTPVFVPESSPTVYELLNYLNILFLGQYTITYDATTIKFTFVATNVNNTITPVNSGHLLGLVNGTTYTGNFTSQTIINIQWENSVYLTMDSAVNGNTLDNVIQDNVNVSSIIARIPINVNTGQTITWHSFKNKNEAIQLATMCGLDSATFSLYSNRRQLPLFYDYTFTIKIEHYEEE